MIFLGEASNLRGQTARHFFAFGTSKDSDSLKSYLLKRYQGSSVALTSNGRSALCLALKSSIPKNSKVVVNAFTCHAVLVAVKAAGCIPIFADIEKDTLNYSPKTLNSLLKIHPDIKAFILQNSLGHTVNILPFEKIAKDNHLSLIEDLAHCTGMFYPDGREVGTVGVAACLSFGKGKSLDTTTGGAVILRDDSLKLPFVSAQKPKLSVSLRSRFYPVFGAIVRALFNVHLEKLFLGTLLKLHWIERSADSPLDLVHRPAHWQAKLALSQLKSLNGKIPLRSFYLVDNREAVLKELRSAGYVFNEIWYDTPISPARYYQKSHFPEKDCPNSVEVAAHIVNLPSWYSAAELSSASKIIKEHLYAK